MNGDGGFARSDETSFLLLLEQARRGDEKAREKLSVSNFPLVRSIARRFCRSGKEEEDLFQTGCIGLLKAIDRFDPGYGTRFSTYAVPLIMGEIRRFLRDDNPISSTRGLREQAVRIERKRGELRQQLAREPELREIAAACGMTAEEILTATGAQKVPLSMSDLLAEHGEKERGIDTLPLPAADDGQELTEKLTMDGLLAELPARLAYVIRGRYYAEKTQSALAEELSLSQAQVSRLEKKALAMIRAKMEA